MDLGSILNKDPQPSKTTNELLSPPECEVSNRQDLHRMEHEAAMMLEELQTCKKQSPPILLHPPVQPDTHDLPRLNVTCSENSSMIYFTSTTPVSPGFPPQHKDRGTWTCNPDPGISIKQFGCSTCIKRFARKSDLVRHERIHTGVRPNVCQVCKKQFIQRSALNVHMRVHTGEKPHRCVLCSKAFSDSSSLARHRRIHSNTKPYCCKVPGCEKAYTRRTTLNKHYFGAHEGWDKPCGDITSSTCSSPGLSSSSSSSSTTKPTHTTISRSSSPSTYNCDYSMHTIINPSSMCKPLPGLSDTLSNIRPLSKDPIYYGSRTNLVQLHRPKTHFYDHPSNYLLTSGNS